MSTRAAFALVGAATLVAAAALAAPAGARVVMRSQAKPARTAHYWTPRRMARARPLELVREGDRASYRRAPSPPPFESFQVPDPSTPPLTAHGKMFGTLRGFGKFECSATVVDSDSGLVVMTAGHCVYEPSDGTIAKRLTFVPSFTDGARPFGRWTARTSRTTPQWIRRGNYDFDYATLTMRRLNGRAIEEVVGARALATRTPRQQDYTAYGYPDNFAHARLMWECDGTYAGDDPRPIRGGPAPIGMGCDMKEGASGGGWIDDLGRLVSVSSFGYQSRRGFLYGPYLTPRAARLVAKSG